MYYLVIVSISLKDVVGRLQAFYLFMCVLGTWHQASAFYPHSIHENIPLIGGVFDYLQMNGLLSYYHDRPLITDFMKRIRIFSEVIEVFHFGHYVSLISILLLTQKDELSTFATVWDTPLAQFICVLAVGFAMIFSSCVSTQFMAREQGLFPRN